jgi:hypothetical protein
MTNSLRIRGVAMLTIAVLTLAACGGDYGIEAPSPAPTDKVLLKDVVIPRLPSPYYHFEYDNAGSIRSASFASGFTMYDVTYTGGRISEMRNNTLGNRDRLEYTYDDAGRVAVIEYVNPSNVIFTTLFFSFAGEKLTRIERNVRVDGGFLIDKTMSFSYYADGNLRTLTVARPRIDGIQEATTAVDTFEQYDAGINVDGFSLIHDEFFDHLVLLPGVQLQQGNPGRQVRTGDGINFTVDYTYVYDDRERPRTKTGDLTITNGTQAGQRFQTLSEFTYY